MRGCCRCRRRWLLAERLVVDAGCVRVHACAAGGGAASAGLESSLYALFSGIFNEKKKVARRRRTLRARVNRVRVDPVCGRLVVEGGLSETHSRRGRWLPGA